MKLLVIRNRQKELPVAVPIIREIFRHLLEVELGLDAYELGIHLVGPKEMARINQSYLRHEGPTDVITFPHADPPALHGELFVCPFVARMHSKQFKTSWQAEVIRYLVHGVLHLQGHDDLEPAKRRSMKRLENRLVRRLGEPFRLDAVLPAGSRMKLETAGTKSR